MWPRLSRWLLFGVLSALLSLLLRWLFAGASGNILGLKDLTVQGELCLIAIGITSSALGDAALFERRYQTARIWALAFCGLNLAASAAFYGYVSGRGATDETFVFYSSAVMFLVAVGASGVCFGISERERKRDEGPRGREPV